MAYALISVSGEDRPGIVYDVTESLTGLSINIEDSSMTALRGKFTMMLIVRLSEQANLQLMKASLAELEQRTGLSIFSQVLEDKLAETMPLEPDCIITLVGGDKIGLVCRVSKAIAEQGCSIVDLSTQSRNSDDGNAYFMALEVASSGHMQALEKALAAVASEMDVEVSLHSMDQDLL